MHFEKLEPSSDFYHLYLQQILDLQDQNLFENLSPDARKKGCLLSSFSADDFRDMSENICVAIALDPPPLCPLASLSVLSLPPGERRNQKLGKLIGYLCINDFNKNSTLEFIRNLYAHCEFLKYKNKLIKEYKTFVPSPLCIDVNYRGTPLFLNLSMAAMNHISADYNLGLTIISENNSRSLAACKGIGFEEISEFKFKNNCFKILACEFS